MILKGKKAQSMVEYAIVLSVILFALTSMNIYLKRGVQARLKDATVSILVSDLAAKGAHQYVAEENKSNFITTADATFQEQVSGDTTNKNGGQTMTRSGTEYSVPEGFKDLLP